MCLYVRVCVCLCMCVCVCARIYLNFVQVNLPIQFFYFSENTAMFYLKKYCIIINICRRGPHLPFNVFIFAYFYFCLVKNKVTV